MYDLPELQLIRAGLDALTIRGADAQFLAQLQLKIEEQIRQASTPPNTKK
jgi:hypothetical protein